MSLEFMFQRLWSEHILKNVHECDRLVAFDFAENFYNMLPSYKHLCCDPAYESLMEAKHKQVYEHLIKYFPGDK